MKRATLGMWVFLVTEIMFFGGMFLAYTLYRTKYPEAFASASNHLDLKLGAINTVVLILSSFTMAMAVYSTQIGKRRNQIISLVLTLLLGITFLGIKAVEYHQKYVDHLIPGRLIPLRPFDASGVHLLPGAGKTKRRDVLLDLLCDDGHARSAHDHRHRCDLSDSVLFLARTIWTGVSQPGRSFRTLLALRRHRLDLSFSVALSTWPASGTLIDMSEHIVPVRVYLAIFAALMLGTALTIWAGLQDFPGPLNVIIALTIAVIKATLVVLYFMHVRYSSRLIWVIFASALFWMGILFALTLSDYWTRSWFSL